MSKSLTEKAFGDLRIRRNFMRYAIVCFGSGSAVLFLCSAGSLDTPIFDIYLVLVGYFCGFIWGKLFWAMTH